MSKKPLHQSCSEDYSKIYVVGSIKVVNLYQTSTTLGLDPVSNGPPRTKKLNFTINFGAVYPESSFKISPSIMDH